MWARPGQSGFGLGQLEQGKVCVMLGHKLPMIQLQLLFLNCRHVLNTLNDFVTQLMRPQSGSEQAVVKPLSVKTLRKILINVRTETSERLDLI